MVRTDSLMVWAPRVLSVVRIMAALLFLEHGTTKLLGFPAGTQPAMFTLSWTQGVIELVGGLLLAIGLFTRPVAFILSGDMAVAYFMAHAPQSFFPIVNRGDAAILYCFIFFYIFFAGPGPWSLDAMWRGTSDDPAYRRRACSQAASPISDAPPFRTPPLRHSDHAAVTPAP